MATMCANSILTRQEKVCPQIHDARGNWPEDVLMANRARRKTYLRAWRKFRGYTQEELGFRMAKDDGAPVSKAHISHLEIGRKQYTQEMLERLAEALDCQPYDLLIGPPDRLQDFHEVAAQIPVSERPRALEVLRAFIPH